MRLPNLLSALLAVCAVAFPAVTRAAGPPVDVAAFARNDTFRDLEISPGGEYFAATVPLDDRSVLAVLDRRDNKVVGGLNLGANTDIAGFNWVSPSRLVISSGRKFGSLDAPLADGGMYGMNADGSKFANLAHSGGAVFLMDGLPAVDRMALVSVTPYGSDTFSRADRIDVYSGSGMTVAKAPVRNAFFVADNAGEVRFARGSNTDTVDQLYYRLRRNQPWTLVNDEGANGRIEHPIGFSADDTLAFLQVEQPAGPDAVVALHIASGVRTTVLVDPKADPAQIIRAPGTQVPIGVRYTDAVPRTVFFDPASRDARLQKSLEAAFPGQSPVVTSTTSDGKQALVLVYSDTNPGDFYIFDTERKKAEFIVSRGAWIVPEDMGSTRPVSLVARDGLQLHGFLTTPKGSDGKNLPVVVMPHGGPIGVYDEWGYDASVQLLAAAGYGVLQVNYRGSANYGRSFQHAGARQWGKAMQDDLTDATKWVITQGIADARRICIYGASYGGYAALMGVAKEPALYRCAVGYVGVYDLPGMYNAGDIPTAGSGRNYLREWLGDPSTLGDVSPNRIATQIKVPVFLAAGGEDQRAPIKQSRMMEHALGAAGVPVETLYYPTEGHGFYKVEHREAFYRQLLAFLARNIGGATALPAPRGADTPG